MKEKTTHHLGFWSTVLLGMNGIIGSGIFLLPGEVMHLTGHWSIAVYACVTLLVLSIAWCFAQCAMLFDRSGGAYVYAKEAFGDFIGFEIGIMRWAVGMIAWASMIVGFLAALSSIWPAASQEPMRTLLILSMTGGLGVLNITGMSIFKYVNNVVTVTKLIPLILFICIGLFFIQKENYFPVTSYELETGAFGSAALVTFYAFGGFESLVVAAGEMKNPRKNLPLAVMLVISFCSFLYFFIQLIAIGLLGEALAGSLTPLSDAAELWVGNVGKWFVTGGMLISIAGTNLSASFLTPQSGVVLAEDGWILRKFAHKGRFGTAVWSIVLTTLLTSVLALSGNFAQIIVISVVSRFAQYITTCLAVFVLPRKFNLQKRLLQRFLMVVIPGFALVGLGWLMLQATLLQLTWGLGALILGVPLYFISKSQKTAGSLAEIPR